MGAGAALDLALWSLVALVITHRTHVIRHVEVRSSEKMKKTENKRLKVSSSLF